MLSEPLVQCTRLGKRESRPREFTTGGSDAEQARHLTRVDTLVIRRSTHWLTTASVIIGLVVAIAQVSAVGSWFEKRWGTENMVYVTMALGMLQMVNGFLLAVSLVLLGLR